MASKTLQQLLGYVTLTGTIQQITRGIPNPLPPKLLTTTVKTLGDSARYTILYGQRQTARRVQYGAPAINRKLQPVGSKDVKLLHTFEEQGLPPLVLQQLRNFDNYDVQQMGQQFVADQMKNFAALFQNLRIAATTMVLAKQVIYFDANGNLLPTSTGAAETISFQMAAANQGQLLDSAGATIIDAPWNVRSTNILLHLMKVKERGAQLTGFPPKHILYGKNIPSYLSQNDYILDYLARNPSGNEKMIGQGEIGQLFDFEWRPGYISFYEDVNGVNQPMIGADQLIIFPEPDEGWWQMMEGSYPVPTTINIVADATAAISSLKTVYGMFAYSMVSQNPPGIVTYQGDTFLPCLKSPDVLFSPVVVY